MSYMPCTLLTWLLVKLKLKLKDKVPPSCKHSVECCALNSNVRVLFLKQAKPSQNVSAPWLGPAETPECSLWFLLIYVLHFSSLIYPGWWEKSSYISPKLKLFIHTFSNLASPQSTLFFFFCQQSSLSLFPEPHVYFKQIHIHMVLISGLLIHLYVVLFAIRYLFL